MFELNGWLIILVHVSASLHRQTIHTISIYTCTCTCKNERIRSRRIHVVNSMQLYLKTRFYDKKGGSRLE